MTERGPCPRPRVHGRSQTGTYTAPDTQGGARNIGNRNASAARAGGHQAPRPAGSGLFLLGLDLWQPRVRRPGRRPRLHCRRGLGGRAVDGRRRRRAPDTVHDGHRRVRGVRGQPAGHGKRPRSSLASASSTASRASYVSLLAFALPVLLMRCVISAAESSGNAALASFREAKRRHFLSPTRRTSQAFGLELGHGLFSGPNRASAVAGCPCPAIRGRAQSRSAPTPDEAPQVASSSAVQRAARGDAGPALDSVGRVGASSPARAARPRGGKDGVVAARRRDATAR